MSLPRCGAASALTTALVALLVLQASAAITPQNVLVLYNTASTESADVAAYYASVHPGVQLLGLTNVGLSEEISADTYLNSVRPQILSALTPSIDVLVTTKGLPLRIRNDHPNPVSYVDPSGVPHYVSASNWKRYSSLESELTQVDTVSTWQQMGDQTWYLSPACNPYFRLEAPFDHDVYGSRLTSRLDAFSKEDVISSIDRAQRAYLGPFHFIVDDDPVRSTLTYDTMPDLANNVLAPSGVSYEYDNTTAFLTNAPAPVMGYVSYGTHGGGTPAPSDYLVDPVNGLTFDLAAGAVFHTHESYNAYSFQVGGNHEGQALVAEWIARGGTVGAGHVQEPTDGILTVTNEDWMFQMLLSGYTWAEAAWGATRQLSYVNTVVGDPLMVFQPLVMDAGYLDVIRGNWGQSVTPGDLSRGDLSWDGRIGADDLDVLRANWGSPPSSVPEPSGLLMLAGLGLAALARFACLSRTSKARTHLTRA